MWMGKSQNEMWWQTNRCGAQINEIAGPVHYMWVARESWSFLARESWIHIFPPISISIVTSNDSMLACIQVVRLIFASKLRCSIFILTRSYVVVVLKHRHHHYYRVGCSLFCSVSLLLILPSSHRYIHANIYVCSVHTSVVSARIVASQLFIVNFKSIHNFNSFGIWQPVCKVSSRLLFILTKKIHCRDRDRIFRVWFRNKFHWTFNDWNLQKEERSWN